MSLDMVKRPLKVVLDTNILVSAIVFGGKPRQILSLVLEQKIQAIISPVLLTELVEILTKKFLMSSNDLRLIEKQIRDKFTIVQPKKIIKVLKDEPDNRVLEAALTGNCQCIITGDRELLVLSVFKEIKIVTAGQFLEETSSL